MAISLWAPLSLEGHHNVNRDFQKSEWLIRIFELGLKSPISALANHESRGANAHAANFLW